MISWSILHFVCLCCRRLLASLQCHIMQKQAGDGENCIALYLEWKNTGRFFGTLKNIKQYFTKGNLKKYFFIRFHGNHQTPTDTKLMKAVSLQNSTAVLKWIRDWGWKNIFYLSKSKKKL